MAVSFSQNSLLATACQQPAWVAASGKQRTERHSRQTRDPHGRGHTPDLAPGSNRWPHWQTGAACRAASSNRSSFFSRAAAFPCHHCFCTEKLTLGLSLPRDGWASSISSADVFCLTSWLSRKSTANHLATSPSTLQMSQVVNPGQGWVAILQSTQTLPCRPSGSCVARASHSLRGAPPRSGLCGTGFNTVGLRHH